MQEIMNTTILGLFFGTIGTTVGGIIGCTIKSQSNKFLSFILSFAGGLMMAVICFDLIPEALEISQISQTIIGIFIGIIVMILCDIIVEKKFNTKKQPQSIKNNLLKTGIIVSIGLAIHNIPEGLAIGSGFDASLKLGYSLAIAICFHDIPEERFQSRHQLRYD
jgi:ZIP family zinc transporter